MSVDAFDARVALRAPPCLAAFTAAQVLSAADVHVATRLGRLAGEGDERVLLAVALAVRAVRGGSVCVDLAGAPAQTVPEAEDAEQPAALPWPDPTAWEQAVVASPLVAVGVAGPVDRPVRWLDGRVYLDRYWRHEQSVRAHVDARLLDPVEGVDLAALRGSVRRVLSAAGDGPQRLAAAACALGRLTVLTGGPGTGKTTTVARLLAVLHEVAGPGLRVALAAPTGKAAARLQEAVRVEVASMTEPDRRRVGEPLATTVHRLLGWRPGTSTRFRHDATHHLPYDLVVVDETSMVSLTLMARLLEALQPTARLLLVGDPDQLASVEAGAVLGDLVARGSGADRLPRALAAALPEEVAAYRDEAPDDADDGDATGRPPAASASVRASDGASGGAGLRTGVVRLTTNHRFSPVIAELAAAVREGRADDALAVLRRGDPTAELVETATEVPRDEETAGLRGDAVAAGVEVVAAARAGDPAGALRALESHRVLLAHRRGPAGVAHWAAVVEAWVAHAAQVRPDAGPWYPGRPLLVTANDRDSGLYNGDTGVVVADATGGVVVAFGDPATPLLVRPHRLPPVETVHAMTVHRGQGSQFATVSLVLPPATSPLLTRELLYTAVTRARGRVRVLGTEAAVRAAVGRPVRRASGLRHPLPG